MNTLRLKALAVLTAGALLFGGAAAMANTDGEDAILGFLRVTVLSQFEYVKSMVRDSGSDLNARFDSVDTKLERIYASCNRTATPTRRVTTAQANTCINSCYTSSALSVAGLTGLIDPPRFIACVSRCPSNTLRNQECAQRYTRIIQGVVNISGEYTVISSTPTRYAEHCVANSEARFHASCRSSGEVIGAGLTACLIDQQTYTCQQDCDANYRNIEGYTMCLLRCNNRTRATEIYNGLRDSGSLNEHGRLEFSVPGNTVIQNTPTVIIPSAPTTPTTLTPAAPTPETYAQCVYRCDTERTTCLARVPQPTTCQTEYNTCYSSCTSRLVGGGAARP